MLSETVLKTLPKFSFSFLKVMEVWNHMRESKLRQIFHFWLNYPELISYYINCRLFISREQKIIKIMKILNLNDCTLDFRIKWLMVCVWSQCLYSWQSHKRWPSLSAMWTWIQRSPSALRKWRPDIVKWNESRASWLSLGTGRSVSFNTTALIVIYRCFLAIIYTTIQKFRVCKYHYLIKKL